MSNLDSFATGLANSINSYLQAGQKQQRDIQTYKAEKQIDQDFSNKNQDQPNEVTPDMAEQLIPGSSKWVNSFQQQNRRLPSIDEVNKGLMDVQTKLQTIQGKTNAASNIKHYLGNDPQGNAIFADNQGNMTSPNGNKYMGQVLPKSSTMPTAATRGSAEFASTILPHIDEMRGLIQQADAKGYIGPASGRIYNQFMAGAVGSTGNDDADNLLGRLRAMDSLLKTGAMRVHFGARGGANMYDHFSDMLNTGKQSAAQLNGSLDTLQSFMQGYANAGVAGGAGSSTPNLEAKKAALRAKLGL